MFDATSLKVELLINDRPLGGLLQQIRLSVDADTSLPKLEICLIPTHLEVDLASLAELKLVDPDSAQKQLIADWERKFGQLADPKVQRKIAEACSRLAARNAEAAGKRREQDIFGRKVAVED